MNSADGIINVNVIKYIVFILEKKQSLNVTWHTRKQKPQNLQQW